MYIFTNHIKLTFNGSINRTFNFDIRYTEDEMFDCTLPNPDREKNLQVKDDGYLYIQGWRITNNKDGIGKIYGSIFCVPKEQYIDVLLSIDSSGTVVVVKKDKADNQISRFLTKLLG